MTPSRLAVFFLLMTFFSASAPADNPTFVTLLSGHANALGTVKANLDHCGAGSDLQDWVLDDVPVPVVEYVRKQFNASYDRWNETRKSREKCDAGKIQKMARRYPREVEKLQHNMRMASSTVSQGVTAEVGEKIRREAAENRRNCELTGKGYYDCDCMEREHIKQSEAYLSNASNDANQRTYRLTQPVGAACLDREGIESYEYKACYGLHRSGRKDAEPYCACVAKSVTADFIKRPIIGNPVYVNSLKRSAYGKCESAGSGMSKPVGVAGEDEVRSVMLGLAIDGISLGMTPGEMEQAALKAGYKQNHHSQYNASYTLGPRNLKGDFSGDRIYSIKLGANDLPDDELNRYRSEIERQLEGVKDNCRMNADYLKCGLRVRDRENSMMGSIKIVKGKNSVSVSLSQQPKR